MSSGARSDTNAAMGGGHSRGVQTVVIVDDDPDARAFIEHALGRLDERVTLQSFARPPDAIVWAAQHVADLVLVDYWMPEMDGLEFMRRLRELPDYAEVPVVMVTGSGDVSLRYAALNAGMTDFLTKPVDAQECVARCRNLLRMRRQQLALEDRKRLLESMVDEATREVRDRERETLFRLARAGEFRDTETGYHLTRIAQYSRLLAKSLDLSEDEAECIELAAPLHDIGKIGIPDQILLKAGALNANEWEIMRTHTTIGNEILRDSSSKYVRMGALIALGHHERFDGSGYPHGVAGAEIPLCARIVAVADVYDALTSQRPYKEAWAQDQAHAYLESAGGNHLDPRIVSAFLEMRDEVERVRREFADRGDGVDKHLHHQQLAREERQSS